MATVQRKLQLPVVFKANSIHTSSLLRNQASTPTAAPAKPQSSSQQQPTIAQFDVRIGRIIEIQKHPNADRCVQQYLSWHRS
jgi:tRNA-binding EMAP/Myf-like protein